MLENINERRKIAQKLVLVMEECSHIIKQGVNEYHKYTYATAEDVLVKVNKALTKNRIASIVIPCLQSFKEVQNLKGNTEHLATVQVKIELVDSESGESVKFVGIGSGQDMGDKAVMKAQTAAIKYAYMMSLCIATGDDPEADSNTDRFTEKRKEMKVRNNEKHLICVQCRAEITEKVAKYSFEKYGKKLCIKCQRLGAVA